MTGASYDIVVPVYNEEAGLPEFFERIRALGLTGQLIFVDNASTDGSLALLEGFPGAKVIRHASNEGYGGSLIDGMAAGTGESIIVIDADCEYPPEAIPELLQALQQHDVVYTSRFLDPALAAAADMPWLKTKGNQWISGMFNALFRQRTTDLYTGCKAYKRKCIEGLQFEQKGFEHVLELAAKLVAGGYDIAEIPVEFRARQTGTSKMSHVSETFKYFRLLLRYSRRHRAGTL